MDQARSDWSAQQASAALALSDFTRHRGGNPHQDRRHPAREGKMWKWARVDEKNRLVSARPLKKRREGGRAGGRALSAEAEAKSQHSAVQGETLVGMRGTGVNAGGRRAWMDAGSSGGNAHFSPS
jgi:hypothetical protein